MSTARVICSIIMAFGRQQAHPYREHGPSLNPLNTCTQDILQEPGRDKLLPVADSFQVPNPPPLASCHSMAPLETESFRPPCSQQLPGILNMAGWLQVDVM